MSRCTWIENPRRNWRRDLVTLFEMRRAFGVAAAHIARAAGKRMLCSVNVIKSRPESFAGHGR
jgi:hypothetical protein